MTTIDIYNPKKEPFGPLSNNYKSNMKICDSSNKCENWLTVSNYIYANMLKNEKHINLLKNFKEFDNIYSTYVKYRNIEEEDVIKTALKKALNVKFQDPKMSQLLLSTGDTEILYLTDNTFLGKNEERKGQNILGKYLMEIRSNLKVKQKEIETDEEKNNMYKSFIIYQLLEKNIQFNGDDLSEYLYDDKKRIFQYHKSKNIDQLIDLYVKNHPENPVLKSRIEQALIDKYQKNKFFELYPELFELMKLSISEPDILIYQLRKKYLERLKTNNKASRDIKSFQIYFDYIIHKRYPNIPEKELEKIKEKELKKISIKQEQEIKKNISILKNTLPLEVKNKINEIDNKYKIPSQEEIDISKTFKLSEYFSRFNLNESILNYKSSGQKYTKFREGEPSIDYVKDLELLYTKNKYQLLSPVYYTGKLIIDNYTFISVTHYILFKLFQTLYLIKNDKEAYNKLLNEQGKMEYYKYIDNKFVDLQIESESIRIKEIAKIGLDTKFSNFKLQKILLMTGDKKIFWNDKKDDVLGIGENFVGNYLVQLRNQLENKFIKERKQLVTIDNLIFILESEDYFKEWIKNRIREYSNNIKKFNNFTKNKYSTLNMRIPIDYKFSKLVIDILYTQCKDIKNIDSKDISIPTFFIEIVRDNFRTNKEFPEILSLFWNNIYSIFYFIIKHLQNPVVYNIKQLLFKLEKIITNQKNESSIKIYEDRFSNCIFYALVKLLKNIYKYNEKSQVFNTNYGIVIDPETRISHKEVKFGDPALSKLDVQLGTSIILNIPLKNIELKDEMSFFVQNLVFINEDIDENKEEDDEEDINLRDYIPVDVENVENEEDINLKDYINVEVEDEDDEEKSDIDYEEESENEENEPDFEDNEERDDYGVDYGLDFGKEKNENTEDEEKIKELQNKITQYFINNDLFSDSPRNLLSKYIIQSIEIIKNYKNISENVKKNRVNFFSDC
jgi:predicted NAD-dependent protein-ADP-ribosyltransferase YbiA (DUF1768 family)